MIFDIAIGATWLAAGYRMWVLDQTAENDVADCRQRVDGGDRDRVHALPVPAHPDRRAVGVAESHRSHRPRGVRRWNRISGHLPRRAAATDVHALPVGRRLAIAGLVSVILTTSWVAAPVHDHPVEDFLPFARHTSVVVYCLTFWVYLIWALVMMAATSLRRARQFRREDPTRSISLMIVGLSAVAEIPAILLWSVSVVITRVTGADTTRINAIGDAILPWPLLVNAIGALSLLVLPYLSDLSITSRRLRVLAPLWRELTEQHPEVHLELQVTGGPLTRLQLRCERAIIEIHDALRLAHVDIDGQPSLERLAEGLHHPVRTGRRASDLLERVGSREADIHQIVDLANAFRARQP